MKIYDIVIIGAGAAGISAALFASKSGLKVAIIEKENIGGINSTGGGMFIKYIFESLKELIQIKNSEVLTIDGDANNISLNYPKLIKKYQDTIIDVVLENKNKLGQSNVDIYTGKGIVQNPNVVVVNDKTLNTKNIILAVGSKPKIPNIKGINEAIKKGFVVYIHKMYQDVKVYDHIAIIGGGPNAVETTEFFSNIGSKVQLIVRSDDILSGIDLEMKGEFKKGITNANVELLTNANVLEFKNNSVIVKSKNKIKEIHVDKIYLATGYTYDGQTCAALNVKTDVSGIITNDNCETSVKGVYAIGDSNNKPKQSNLAVSEGIVAVKHILGIFHKFKYNFYVSEIVGLKDYVYYGYTEEEVKKLCIVYDVRHINLSVLKVETNKNKRIVGKMLFNSVTGELLGVHMIGENSFNYITDVIRNIKDYDGVEEKSRLRSTHFSIATSLIDLIQDYRSEYVDSKIKQNIIAYYQPKYDLKHNRIIGCEALMRVVQDGVVHPPQKIIEVYERNGMIKYVDMKVLNDSCQLINDLEEKKLIDEDFKISVNFSINTLLDTSVEEILLILDKYNVSPLRIVIEVTERVMNFVESIKTTLQYLKIKGFTISIDDYSSGHSSLSIINSFPIDEIKFDMSLLPSLEDDDIKKKVYIDLYNMFDSLGYTIISEGVETSYQIQFLRENNMRYIQGYIFSRPINKTNIIKLLETNKKAKIIL